MSIRLNLSVLTVLAAFAATIPGCGDDADGDPPSGGEAGDGDTGTGGKSTSGGSTSSDAGSAGAGEEAGAPSSTGGKSGGTGGTSGDAGAPSTEAGAPGEAGATGTGGSSTGGSSGTGGKSGGGGNTGECTVPQCLIDLVTGCEAQGECTMGLNFDPLNPPTNPSELSVAICWENGVKAGMRSFDEDVVVFEYQKNGDTCYTAEFPVESAATTEVYYKDASGNLVATQVVSQGENTSTITCEESGESVTYSPDDCGGDEQQPGEQPDIAQCADDPTCSLD